MERRRKGEIILPEDNAVCAKRDIETGVKILFSIKAFFYGSVSGNRRDLRSHLAYSGGFTLLELIISITMIAIIVSIISGVLRLGYRSVESGERKIEHLERTRAALTVIESQVQSSFPFPYFDEVEGESKYYFTGKRDLMQFPTNYSLWGGDTGYVIATYAVESDEKGKQALHVTENIIGMEGERETTLSEVLDSIYFEYFLIEPTEEIGTWKEEWTDNTNTPSKVRVHFIRDSDDLVFTIPIRVRGTPENLEDFDFFREEDEEE